MHNPILKYVVVVLLSAIGGGAAMFRHALLFGDDPYQDGTRAFIIEFAGMWIAAVFLFLSFMEPGRSHHWTMRGLAVLFGVAGIVVGSHFSDETAALAAKKAAALESDTNTLHLE